MAYQDMPKMSLVAQFDDLCRYTKVLTAGSEAEFKTFVESQIVVLRKWKESEKEVQKLKSKVTCLESEKKRLETQIKHIKSLCENEVMKRKKIELEKNSMERQIALIKEVLLADGNMDNQTKEKLFLLSTTCKQNADSPPRLETIEESVGSLLSLSDVDRTDDDLDNDSSASTHRRKHRSRGKRSSSENILSAKKKKYEEKDVSPDEAFDIEVSTAAPRNLEALRSNSEPTSNSPDVPIFVRYTHKSDSEQFKGQTYHLRRNNSDNLSGSTPVGRYSSGGKLSRTHLFCTKTVIRTEKCYPCGRIIKFCKQALKCQDCRVTCHPECKDKCPVPCIPVTSTPTKGSEGTIADYTSSMPPMIPSLIVHCVNEIESRGRREIGLYRIPGSEREVKDLKEKFLRGKNIPCLSQLDVHTICGTVKEFLRSLKEPLIPRSSWQNFVDAAEVSDINISLNALYNVVCDELPQPNKDTLAFLILHLQRIAEAPECKMPTENLAKVFGPTIIGYSIAEPSDSKILTETKHQYKVMQRLLSISADYWQNLLNIESDAFNTIPKTPVGTSAARTPRLGPLYSSGQKSKGVQLGRTPLAPRNAKSLDIKTGRKFFTSPLAK